MDDDDDVVPIFRSCDALKKDDCILVSDDEEEQEGELDSSFLESLSKKKKKKKKKKSSKTTDNKEKRKRKRNTSPSKEDVSASGNGNSTAASQCIVIDDEEDEKGKREDVIAERIDALSTPVLHSPSALLNTHPAFQQAFRTIRERDVLVSSMNTIESARNGLEERKTIDLEEDSLVPLILAVKIRGQSDPPIKFKIFKSEKMEKILKIFCAKKRIKEERCIMKYSGVPIKLHEAPQDYGMEDNDVIEVIVEDMAEEEPETMQRNATTVLEKKEGMTAISAGTVRLKVRLGSDEPRKYRLGKDEKLARLFSAFCQELGVTEKKVQFMFDGEKLNGEHTPNFHDMEDEDLIDATYIK